MDWKGDLPLSNAEQDLPTGSTEGSAIHALDGAARSLVSQISLQKRCQDLQTLHEATASSSRARVEATGFAYRGTVFSIRS